MNIGQKLAPLIVKSYVNFLSPAAFGVRGPRFAPIAPKVIEFCGDLAEVRVRSRGSIEASIISASAPGPDHHLGQFVPLDIVLAWRGLADPLGRRALGRVEHHYGANGERSCTTQNPSNLPWLLTFCCFAPGCPPLSLEDCRPGRTVELFGYECDIATQAGEWRGRDGERSTLIYVTAWQFGRWWGKAPSDIKKTSSYRAGAGGLINQQLTDLTRS